MKNTGTFFFHTQPPGRTTSQKASFPSKTTTIDPCQVENKSQGGNPIPKFNRLNLLPNVFSYLIKEPTHMKKSNSSHPSPE
jgi:hypothetical protein